MRGQILLDEKSLPLVDENRENRIVSGVRPAIRAGIFTFSDSAAQRQIPYRYLESQKHRGDPKITDWKNQSENPELGNLKLENLELGNLPLASRSPAGFEGGLSRPWLRSFAGNFA